ncbi:MAG: L-seryl-tRNA(Sec) selenium transferase [Acidobacteria bacterium]|nr:L-seryl-tRNA(Sec) selenium transferase [Acidobacteriota bacterium]
MDGSGLSWFNRTMASQASLLRHLPAVERLLAEPRLEAALDLHGRVAVRDAARRRLAALREEIRSGKLDLELLTAKIADLPGRVVAEVEEACQAPYKRVINASGILIHTNLGRSPLALRAVAAATRAAAEPLALEYDLEEGRRGSRRGPVLEILAKIFPDTTGLVVGNNAAAVLLALNTWCRGRGVLISRGELVEIGGSFRVPEILVRSGAVLKEVGTTNRTRIDDFRAGLNDSVGAILRVHPSNFHQIGFTEQAGTRELAELAQAAGIPFMVDQGSGNLHDLTTIGIHHEPTVASILEAGADVVTFSGDKLLGGPQAGLIVGGATWVEPMAANPMARALRPDKMILAAMVETLRLHEQGLAFAEIPVLRRLALKVDALRLRAEAFRHRLETGGVPRGDLTLQEGISRVGGGSAPAGHVATVLVALAGPGLSLDDLAARLRAGTPAVVARVSDNRLLLDLRTVDESEDEILAEAVLQALGR